MAKTPRIYHRLGRPLGGAAAYSSLWEGPDHLLLVKSTGYTEEYQQIQYTDVQSIMVTESERRMTWNIVWIVAGVITAFPLVLGLIEHQEPIVSGILMAVILTFLAINHFRGPTCKVFLITRVQTVRLPFVRRRKAEKILARIQPLIDAAQADLLVANDVLPTAPPSVT